MDSFFRWSLSPGTARRLMLSLFRPGYVKKQLAARAGECRRCGACCSLVWKCPFFGIKDGVPSCAVYRIFRFPNCTKFPIDQRDLADRDAVSPDTRCGYSWPEGHDQSDD